MALDSIGMADVELITEHIARLRRVDYRYGSGRVRASPALRRERAVSHEAL